MTKTVSKVETELRYCLVACVRNKLIACFLDMKEAYARLKASKNDAMIFFFLYYEVKYKSEGSIYHKNTQHIKRYIHSGNTPNPIPSVSFLLFVQAKPQFSSTSPFF